MADRSDNSCVSGFLEIDPQFIPHDETSNNYCMPDFICSVVEVEVKQEDSQHVKLEAAEVKDINDRHHSDFYCRSDFICPVVEVKQEDIKVEAADDNDIKDRIRSDFYCRPDFICPVIEVKQEDLQDVKVEVTDENDVNYPSSSMKVSLYGVCT